MFPRHCTQPRSAGGLPGLLLAVLALVSQLALGAIVLPDEASAREQSVAALDALTVFCDAGTPAAPERQPGHHRSTPDCVICPLSVALALPAVVLSSTPALPAPESARSVPAGFPPPARAPPGGSHRDTPPPRGPPALA